MSSVFDVNGDAAALIASVDWMATSVGPPERWPPHLRTAVSLLLESRFPMLLCWGPDLVQFYNDQVRMLGTTKRPASATSAPVTFAEWWHIVAPLLDPAMAGDAVWHDDTLVPLDDQDRAFVTLVAREIGRSLGQAEPRRRDERAFESPAGAGRAVASILPDVSHPGRDFAPPIEAAATVTARPRQTILVVDDNAAVRKSLARLLSDRWTVATAANGEEALDAVRASAPALVIADVVMPKLDGFGLVGALRADPATRDIPVIMLSVRGDEDDRIHALQAHADDYLLKPVSPRELRARVEAQLLRAEIRAIEAAHDRQLADLVRHAPVAVALLRGSGHVVEFANDAFASMVGGVDLVGRRIADAVAGLGPAGVVDQLDDVYASAQPSRAASVPLSLNRGHRDPSEPGYFNFACQPLRDHRGDVAGIVVVAVEVTAAIEARNEADAANRAKDQFLAVLGHELRTPLSPILTAVRLLELKGSNDEHEVKLRQTILRQALHMQRLIEDLLDVGRIVAGKLQLDKRCVSLATLVQRAVEAASPFIDRQQHTLTVVMPDHDVYVEADAERFTQVLWNLLNNAAKYTVQGGQVELSVEDAGSQVVVRVRDHGVGIPHAMLDRVFDRFVQVSRDGTVNEGLGIGLSVAKTIVELHEGTIVAHSDGPDTGSEFVVSIPVGGAASPARLLA
jgi:signal transduction histidine kinase